MKARIESLVDQQILCSHKRRTYCLKAVLFIALSFFSNSLLFGQVGISSASITPDASSILELRSTTSGFLPPRMTTVERDAILSPAAGLVIYNTNTKLLNFYNGNSWEITGGSPGEPAIVPVNASNKYWNGYKSFVSLHSDSLTEGNTNLFYTTAREVLKLNISDTPGMLSSYQSAINANTNNIGSKVNITDTAAMMANYQNAINNLSISANTDLASKLKIADTAAMLTNYQSAINSNTITLASKVNFSDTAVMLSNYRTSYQPIGNYVITAPGKSGLVNNDLTFQGTDGTTITFPTLSTQIPVIKVVALPASLIINVNFNSASVFTYEAFSSSTMHASGGVAGASYTIIITSTGALNIITLGTNFRTNGTITTSGISGKAQVITFVFDGTAFYETSRSVAM